MHRLASLLVVILIVAGLGWYVFRWKHASPQDTEGGAPTSTPAQATSSLPTIKKDTGGSHPGLTYGEAVKIYTNRRIQFDPDCVVIPNRIVLKNNTMVMFDNRFKDGRDFFLDGRRSYIRGYDFRILNLSSPKLPHTIVVDCGTGKNNGEIILE